MNNINLLEKIFEKKDLSATEIQFLLTSCINSELNESQIAGLLIGLRMKGETIEEISGLIQGMRKQMIAFPAISEAIDTCGTGGDKKGTFNISTAVAFVVAGAGISVVKHGNKAASSLCGSADVLSELGVNIMLTPEQATKVLKKTGIVFLFAPLYHPAMKQIAPIRKALSTRTVFNFLGPFLNPAQVKRQLIGVPTVTLAEKLAQVASQLGYVHVLIVSSDNGMDEIALNDNTKIFEIVGTTVLTRQVNPQTLGFKKATFAEIRGGSISENADSIKKILSGKRDAKRDIVILNSAYALYAADRVKSIEQGIVLAQTAIDSGAASRVLHNFIQETQNYAK